MKTPAQTIIAKCGGAKVVAGLLNVRPSTVHRWSYPKSRRGTGGLIPTQRQRPLILAARSIGVELTPEDFFSPDETLLCARCGAAITSGEPGPGVKLAASPESAAAAASDAGRGEP